MIFRSLFDHLNYIAACDEQFRLTGSQGDQRRLASYSRVLRHLEWCRLALAGTDLEGAHHHAAWSLARRMASVPEKDFPEPPSPDSWTTFASDHNRLLSVQSAAVKQLTTVLGITKTRYPVALYGNVKSRSGIERKIREFYSGYASLDLWDLNRVRLVVPDVRSVELMSHRLWGLFGPNVLRCRNYYVRPRQGWNDPYRGIHFILKIGGDSPPNCVEVQVLTVGRDAIGLVDHELVHGRSARYCDGRHERWLRHLSWAANLVDTECVSLGSGLQVDSVTKGSPRCGEGFPSLFSASWR